MSEQTIQPVHAGTSVWKAALLAGVLALVTNSIILHFTKPYAPTFVPLEFSHVVAWTIIGTLGATLTYWCIAKRPGNPTRTFVIVALTVLVVSFVPDLAFFWIPPSPATGTATTAGIFALMLMHVVVASIIVPILIRRPKPS